MKRESGSRSSNREAASSLCFTDRDSLPIDTAGPALSLGINRPPPEDGVDRSSDHRILNGKGLAFRYFSRNSPVMHSQICHACFLTSSSYAPLVKVNQALAGTSFGRN